MLTIWDKSRALSKALSKDQIDALLNELLPTESWIKFYYEIAPELEQAALRAAPSQFAEQAKRIALERAAELVGMRIDLDTGELYPNPNAKWAISDTTREQLRDLIENTDPVALPVAIRDAMAFSPYRARMISRTEIARVQTKTEMGYARSTGQTMKWLVLSNTHTEEDDCDTCADDGMIPIDDVFSSGDDGPPIHPSCSCSLRFGKEKTAVTKADTIDTSLGLLWYDQTSATRPNIGTRVEIKRNDQDNKFYIYDTQGNKILGPYDTADDALQVVKPVSKAFDPDQPRLVNEYNKSDNKTSDFLEHLVKKKAANDKTAKALDIRWIGEDGQVYE